MIQPDDLLRLPFFAGFNQLEVAQLIAAGRQRVFEAGQVVFGENLPDDCSLFVAVRGGIRVTIAGKDHQQFVIGNAGEGTVFGEMSFCDGLPRSATITAIAPLETLSLSRVAFESLCSSDPSCGLKIARRLSHIISMRLRNADKFVVEAKASAAMATQAAPPPPPPPPPPMRVTTPGRTIDLSAQPDLIATVDKLPKLENTQAGGLHDRDIKATPDIFHRGDPTRQQGS